MSTSMRVALRADGDKLRALSGEDHGPFDLPDAFTEEEFNGLMMGTHYMDADGNVWRKPVK